MRAELANLNHCAVPLLSRAAVNLCWFYNNNNYPDKVTNPVAMIKVYIGFRYLDNILTKILPIPAVVK